MATTDDLYHAWEIIHLSDEELFKKEDPGITYRGYINLNHPQKVIYNPPATIVLWPTGDKTVVKCCEDDIYDPMTGFLLCCLKHYIRADNDPAKFHRFLKEFGPKPEQYNSADTDLRQAYAKLQSSVARVVASIGDASVRILEAFGSSDKEDANNVES